MDFRLSDEQQMLLETVTDLFGDLCTGADLRRLLDSGEARDTARWEQIVAMGLPGLLAPESAGGSGLGTLEMALVSIAAGYAMLPEPLINHAGLAVPLLAESCALSPEMLSGETVAVSSTHGLVADADTAAALLMQLGDDVYLVDRATAELTRVKSFDPFRRLYRVYWKTEAAKRVDLPAGAWAALADRGALFAAAQMLGLAQRAIDLGVAYAKERQQFGKPIGSFQAIKHHLATAQVKVEFARPVLLAAAALLDEGSPLASARISHAKIAAGAAADTAAHVAVQVHGAMGFSWEVDVHFALKRSLALAQAWGTPDQHRTRLLDHILSQPLGPDRTFGAPFPHTEAALEPA